MNFKQEFDFLQSRNLTKQLHKISQEKINLILKEAPKLPMDFIHFLSEIGSGTIGQSQFKIYDGLVDLSDLGLQEIHSSIQFKIFGDDFAGDFAGFDTYSGDDLVFEFLHDSNDLVNTGKTFRQYVNQKILSGI